MIRNLGVLALCLATGSSVAIAQAPPDSAPRTRVQAQMMGVMKVGDVTKFVAAVAAIDSGGHCVPPLPHPTGGGAIAYRYTYGTKATAMRNLVVVVDSLNRIQHYSDLRGDLRAPFDKSVTEANPLGPLTSITLNATEGLGTVENRQSSLSNVPILVRAPAFMNAPNLDYPAKLIAFVLNECRKD